MFNVICLCNIHDLLFGSNPYWGILFGIFTDLLSRCYHTHSPASTIVD